VRGRSGTEEFDEVAFAGRSLFFGLYGGDHDDLASFVQEAGCGGYGTFSYLSVLIYDSSQDIERGIEKGERKETATIPRCFAPDAA
jgi:hypothetical protein